MHHKQRISLAAAIIKADAKAIRRRLLALRQQLPKSMPRLRPLLSAGWLKPPVDARVVLRACKGP